MSLFHQLILVMNHLGQVYSRIKLDIYCNPQNLRLYFGGQTNPEGSRNLEYDERFNVFEAIRRREMLQQRVKERREKAKQQSIP